MSYIKNLLSKSRTIAAAAVAATVGTLAASPAHAALDLTGISVDTADFMTIAAFLITALVGFWGVKKGMALFGK
jgi:hypothetical protein